MAGQQIINKYFYTGPYEQISFITKFHKEFSKSPKYRIDLFPALMKIVDFIGSDGGIVDVRWAAYLLATTLWETTYPRTEEITNKKGKKRKIRRWLYTMEPVEEIGHGKGRR